MCIRDSRSRGKTQPPSEPAQRRRHHDHRHQCQNRPGHRRHHQGAIGLLVAGATDRQQCDHRAVVGGARAVSYTHLDVYKRQANAFRPFCSERCKLIDLGAWASEAYRVPVQETKDPLSAHPPVE